MNLQQSDSRSQSRSRSRDKSKSHSRSQQYSEDEQEFQANQEIIRSLLRIQQNRQQPIDKFVKNVWIFKEKLPFDSKAQEIMAEPKSYLVKLSVNQLEEILQSTTSFQKIERRLSSEYTPYWKALKLLTEAVIADKRGQNTINPLFRSKVDEIISKPVEELKKMKETIDSTLMGRGGSNDAFWGCVKQKIEEKCCEQQLHFFYEKYKTEHPQQKRQEQESQYQEYNEPISPILGPVSLVNSRLITNEEQQITQRQAIAQKIFKQQFEKSRQKLQENLSLPKNHNLLSSAIVHDSTVAIDFITQEIIQFEKYKRLEEDQEQFDDWVPCETQGRFRDKKPQYICRRRVTIEWNKYNTQHYTEDNPPPKAVQGYKFNIFYPELLDKQKTPQYYLQATQSPDYCIIKFKAGPPYKDVAFKIQRREWDFTQKSGFQSIFHKGILQLYFNFKKPKFRI